MRLIMGDIDDQKAILEAIKNIRETWEELINIVQVLDENKPF